MDNPILSTKLNTPPLRTALVQRNALLDRLDDGLSSRCSLSLISAPAGCGKTTLASEWLARLAERGIKTAWLTLDDGDNNPVVFLRYLVAVFRRLIPDIGLELLTLVELPTLPPTDSLLTGLINELEKDQVELVLVLDEYQVVSSDWVNQAVRFLYTHAPIGLHVVILTRQDPQFGLARLRATGEIVEIRKSDLDFSAAETKEFLNQRLGLVLKDDQIERLNTRTEGWITGLQIAALSLRGGQDVEEFLNSFSGSHQLLFDYLAEEVLRTQSAKVIDFLSETSILSRLCGPLCDVVTGNQDSQAVLQQLEQNNMFLEPLDDQRCWYRYHPLFADFLRQNLNGPRKSGLFLRAAGWCENHSTLPEAISYAVQAKEGSALARLIRLAALGALRTGSILLLGSWLDSYLAIDQSPAPDLLILKGITLMLRNEIEEARRYADLAEGVGGTQLPDLDRGRLNGLRAYLAHARYSEIEAERLGLAAMALLDEDQPVIKGMVLSLLGQVQRQLGNPREGEITIRAAVRCGDSSGQSLGSAAAAANLIAVLDVLGRRREAEAFCVDSIGKMTDKGKINPLSFIIRIPWGMVAYESNQVEKARELLSQGFADCRRLGFNPIIIGGLPTMALIRSARGDTAGAIQDAHDMGEEAARYQVTMVARMARVLEMNLALRAGDPTLLETWLPFAGLDPGQIEPEREEEYTTLVRYWIFMEYLDRAVDLLKTLIEPALKAGRLRSLITFEILHAQALVKRGDKKAGWKSVIQAVKLAQPNDYIRLFVDEGRPVLNMLVAFQTDPEFYTSIRPDEEAFIRLLITAFQPGTGDAAVSAENSVPAKSGAVDLLEPLSPRELEVLALLAQDVTIQEISHKLYLTLNTLKSHTGSIYGKLDVHSRISAVVKARELGIIK